MSLPRAPERSAPTGPTDWVEVVPVPIALLITYAGTVAKNFTQEQREKRRLSRFFSPDVVAEIIRHKDDSTLAATLGTAVHGVGGCDSNAKGYWAGGNNLTTAVTSIDDMDHVAETSATLAATLDTGR